MKTMTCKQLGGACNKEFQGETFEEIAKMSNEHGSEMCQKGDKAHLEAMNEMKALMQNPEAMRSWFESKREEFELLKSNG